MVDPRASGAARYDADDAGQRFGFIPARAGRTFLWRSIHLSTKGASPRGGGGGGGGGRVSEWLGRGHGLQRGRITAPGGAHAPVDAIPAPAGGTRSKRPCSRSRTAHPRRCGAGPTAWPALAPSTVPAARAADSEASCRSGQLPFVSCRKRIASCAARGSRLSRGIDYSESFSSPLGESSSAVRTGTHHPDCRSTAGETSARSFRPSASITLRTVSKFGTRSPDSAL